MSTNLASFTDVLGGEEIADSQGSQPISLPSSGELQHQPGRKEQMTMVEVAPPVRGAGQRGEFRSVEEIDAKYRDVFTYPYFNLIQSRVIDDALYSEKSMVVCAPTGSGKTVVFEMAIVQLMMELEKKNFHEDLKIIYMAPVKALCTERLTEWYSKFTKLGLMCIEVTGDTDVDFSQLKPYRIIITTPEKWDMLTRRWRDHKGLVETIKLFLIDEVHILNDETRGPVLEAVVSRMKTIESSAQSVHRIEQLQKQYQDHTDVNVSGKDAPRIRFVAVSATINNPGDVAAWLGSKDRPAVYYKFGDECRPVKLKRIVEGYPCPEGTSIFKFDIILNYKLWPIIQKYHDGKPTLIFCNTRKSVTLTAEALSRELTISFTPEQKARLTALASTIKNKKLQALVLSGVGCHHAGLLFEERMNIETAFRNRDLPILITTTTLAMGVNLPAHLVIIKNTQQYVKGAYQEYSISTVLQMVGRAGRPQFDTEATAVIMTRLADKPRYQALVGGSEPLQSYLHKRLPENLNSEAALGTVTDVAQCVQWLRSTFLFVRAARDPKWYLGLPPNAPPHQISKKIEELCVTAMNGLASSGLITMDEASCIQSTEAGRLMSVFYLDLQTMKQIIKIEGTETLERLLWIICESHELADMHLRVDERRCLNTLNRNNAAATIRFPMKGKIGTRQMKLNCVIQAILGCLPIPDPSLNQEAMKIMRIADRVCKCLVAYLTRPDLISSQPKFYSAVLNSLILAKCVSANLWENSPYVSKQLKGIGPTFSTLLASAGKTNFMMLEESHPRDLERIMNKGAPAGNVIRKQVSLLPKYQLTIMPMDEKKVSIQLSLLNKEHLAENFDNLTAGDRHKSYIVAGDSENHLLLLTAFQDKDLISVYDGTITYEITRKHNFEHKILIHCVSSNFVGLDVQDEYTFKNIKPLNYHEASSITNIMEEQSREKPTLKQTSITDVYKERKRKCNETDVTQSKEKKKRENGLIDKFRNLKESFGFKSKKLMQDLYDTKETSNRIIKEMTTSSISFNNENHSNVQFPKDSSGLCVENNQYQSHSPVRRITDSIDDHDYPEMNIEHMNDDDFMADECVNSILKEIENEISITHDHRDSTHNKTSINSPSRFISNEGVQVQRKYLTNPTKSIIDNNTHLNQRNDQLSRHPWTKGHDKGKKRRINTKSNFNFIHALQKKTESKNEDDEVSKDNDFSETIKHHIEKFLLKTNTTCHQTDTALFDLLDDRNMTQAPEYGKNTVIKPDTSVGGFISCTEKPQSSVENETENNFKDSNDNSRDYKECQLTDNCMQSTIQSYDLIDDLVDLPDCTTSKDATINSLETQGPTIANNLNSENQRFVLSEKDSSRNTNKECVLICNNNKTAIEFNESPCKVNEVDIDDSADGDQYSSDSKVMQTTNINENSQANEMESRRSIYSNYTHIDFNLNNTITNLTPHNKIETKSPINVNNTGESEQEINRCEIKSEKPGDNLLQRASVSNKNDEYKCNSKDDVEKGYINRYSLTATKIDVSSKNMDDFQIQYIRKLKVDLDVMEIVSNRKCQPKNINDDVLESKISNNVYDTNYSNFNDSNITSNGNINNKTKQTTNPYVCKVMDTVTERKPLINNDNMNISQNNFSSVVHCNQIDNKIPSAINKSNFMTAMQDVGKSPSSQTINYNKKFGNKDDLVAISKNEVSDAKIDDIKCTRNIYGTATEKALIENDLQVENILDKYSKILKKSEKPHNTSIATTQSLQEINLKKPSKEHTKRPFKICDIDNKLESLPPLPKSIIVDVVRSPRPSDDDVLTRIKEIETLNSPSSIKPPQQSKYTKQDTENLVVGDLRCLKPMDNLVIKERELNYTNGYNRNYMDINGTFPIPVSLALETTELNIVDQSMFDPKTLLQSLSKDPDDDEIIPPPVQFCDDISYSPTTAEYDVMVQEYDALTETPQEPDNISLQELNDSHSLLTQEKETWTLSKEDEWKSLLSREGQWEPREFQPNPIRSFTVTRVNSPGDELCLSEESSRQAKLSNFKFTQKAKMRI